MPWGKIIVNSFSIFEIDAKTHPCLQQECVDMETPLKLPVVAPNWSKAVLLGATNNVSPTRKRKCRRRGVGDNESASRSYGVPREKPPEQKEKKLHPRQYL